MFYDNLFSGNRFGLTLSNRLNVDMGLAIIQSPNLATLPLGLYESSAGGAMFGPEIPKSGLLNVEIVQDSANLYGCTAFDPSVAGRVVLIRDGGATPGQVCNPAHPLLPTSFVRKVRNAQAAGAAGVIFINYNQEDNGSPVRDPFPVPEDDGTTLNPATPIMIPSLMVSNVVGGQLEAAAALGTVRANLLWTVYTPNVFQGAAGENREPSLAYMRGGLIELSGEAGLLAHDVPYNTSRADMGTGPGNVELDVAEVYVMGNETGILARNPKSHVTLYDSVVAFNLTVGATAENVAVPTVAENVYWMTATGPFPIGSGDPISALVDADPYAYWGGSLRVAVSTDGGSFLIPVFINDRYTKHRLNLGPLPQFDRMTFHPPRNRQGAGNAAEVRLLNTISIPGSSLTIQYDPATDIPPAGLESEMHFFRWDGAAWIYIPESGRDPVNNTLTAPISQTGIYAVRWDDSIAPTGLDDWMVHD